MRDLKNNHEHSRVTLITWILFLRVRLVVTDELDSLAPISGEFGGLESEVRMIHSIIPERS